MIAHMMIIFVFPFFFLCTFHSIIQWKAIRRGFFFYFPRNSPDRSVVYIVILCKFARNPSTFPRVERPNIVLSLIKKTVMVF